MDHTSAALKVSFCTTCKGRLHHLKETLPKNLAALAGTNAEIVLLDYDSENEKTGEKKGDLKKWLEENFRAELDSGRLRYSNYSPAPHFKMAHAKNMAHRLATGDVLCNLDADNAIAPGFAEWLDQQFKADPNIIALPDWRTVGARRSQGEALSGIMGRLSVSRDHFSAMGGYNEQFGGWDHDDDEFTGRAYKNGLARVTMPPELFGKVIEHSNADRTSALAPADRAKAEMLMSATPAQKGAAIEAARAKAALRVNVDGRVGCPEQGAYLRDIKGQTIPMKPLPIAAAGADKWASPELISCMGREL